jgi:predicted porin
MKKLLMSSAAVLAMAATPALAESPIELDLGGYFNGYLAANDQDEATGFEANQVDWLRNTELHLTGETTLDNGLVVGLHFEAEADGGNSMELEESYLYFAGQWGRINAGAEDGAAYLLQVAAPSADSNVDGIKQQIQPVNYTVAGLPAFTTQVSVEGIDYDQDLTTESDKLTYLTPVLYGFQAGASFTPDIDSAALVTAYGVDDLTGVRAADEDDEYGEAYEGAVRYEGVFNELGFAVGAGYTHLEFEDATAGAGIEDDRTAWNVGLDVDFGPFGIGAIYLEDDQGEPVGVDDEEIIVVGADYTTGPFKLGASWYNADNALGNDGYELDRYTGGVVYTYGPGMTFRGSIQYVEVDTPAATADVDATSVLLGTQVLF